MSTPRESFGLAALGGYLYAVSGNTAGGVGGGVLTSSAERYDPLTDAWSPIAAFPQARYMNEMVSNGEALYALGGWNTAMAAYLDIIRYEPSSDRWVTLPQSLTISRRAAGDLLLESAPIAATGTATCAAVSATISASSKPATIASAAITATIAATITAAALAAALAASAHYAATITSSITTSSAVVTAPSPPWSDFWTLINIDAHVGGSLWTEYFSKSAGAVEAYDAYALSTQPVDEFRLVRLRVGQEHIRYCLTQDQTDSGGVPTVRCSFSHLPRSYLVHCALATGMVSRMSTETAHRNKSSGWYTTTWHRR